MDLKSGLWLVAPSVKDASCSNPRYSGSFISSIGPLEIVQGLLILMLTIGIIGANLLLIFVINHRRYSPYIQPQVRHTTDDFIIMNCVENVRVLYNVSVVYFGDIHTSLNKTQCVYMISFCDA